MSKVMKVYVNPMELASYYAEAKNRSGKKVAGDTGSGARLYNALQIILSRKVKVSPNHNIGDLEHQQIDKACKKIEAKRCFN